jgi:hypothetical protein
MNTTDNNKDLKDPGKKVNVQIAAAKFNNAISSHISKSSNSVKTSPSHAYCEVVANEMKLSPRLHIGKRIHSPATAMWVVVEDDSDDLQQCSLSDSLFSDEGSPAEVSAQKYNTDHQVSRNARHSNTCGSNSVLNGSTVCRQNIGGRFQPSPPSHSTRTSPRLRSAQNARSVRYYTRCC